MLHPATSEFSDRHIRQEKLPPEPENVPPILALSLLSQVPPLLKQRSRHCWVALDNSAKARPENYRQDYPTIQHLILAHTSAPVANIVKVIPT
jgi:hypothetical protein